MVVSSYSQSPSSISCKYTRFPPLFTRLMKSFCCPTSRSMPNFSNNQMFRIPTTLTIICELSSPSAKLTFPPEPQPRVTELYRPHLQVHLPAKSWAFQVANYQEAQQLRLSSPTTQDISSFTQSSVTVSSKHSSECSQFGQKKSATYFC